MTIARLIRCFVRKADIAATAVCLLIGLIAAVPVSWAVKSPTLIDKTWTSPDFSRQSIRSVAVLPAVAPDSYSPTHQISDTLMAIFRGDGRRWMPPLSAWHGLGKSEIDRLTLFRTIATQVRESGRTNPQTSARVANLLAVDALMITRVDRWEQIPDATDVTAITARAELVASDGSSLWQVEGRSRVYTTSFRAGAELPAPAQGLKILTVTTGGGSSGGNSSASNSAGSGSSQSGGGNSPPPPPTQTTKIERKITPVEDLMRAEGTQGTPEATGSFAQAVSQLVAAWARQRPAAWFLTGSAMGDSASKGAGTPAKP